jgi:penicillin amidase
MKKFCVFTLILIQHSFLFSQTNQELKLPGLISAVEVLRDNWGVNHIYAKNEHDLFFAQGYCAAKDRLFQFEIWRRQATGTVAEILGERELKRDIGTRLFKYRGDIKKELKHYHPRGESIINAYVQGVNAYINFINQFPEKLPIEFKLLQIQPQTWTPEVVISRHQGLLGNITQELNLARAVNKVGEEKVKNIVWFHPKNPNLKMDSTINKDLLNQDILGLYNAYRKDVEFKKSDFGEKEAVNLLSFSEIKKQPEPDLFLQSQEMEGSNNWIISGTKTSSGFPMLANDPHRKIAVPSLRYIVHLVAPGWNVIGGGEPEIPGVSIGHNEKGAWGLTIFETDGEDFYVYDLNPKNLKQYWHKGKWVDMKIIQDSIPVKNSNTQKVSYAYTIHGPVTLIDSANHKAYAIRAAWMEPGGAPYLASLRIDQATNWEEFREACSYSHIPGENMIWADKKGNIGWQAVGIIPIRKKFSGYVPIPGDGRFEWEGFLPIKERPSILNPAKGFFATANQHVTPETYSHWNAIGYTWADPFRGDRINQILSDKKNISMEEMGSLQTDYYSIPASEITPMLKNISFADSLTNHAKNIITNWNYVLDKNSIAAGIYVMWEKQIASAMAEKFIPKEVNSLITFQLTKIIQYLKNPTNFFGLNGIQERDELLFNTFILAVKNLKLKLGSSTEQWIYGQPKYKHISFEHQLSAFVSPELKNKLNIGPLPRGGNGSTPGSTGSADNQQTGASFRLLIDTKNWDDAKMINTPGQSGDPDSPFYRNLFNDWANDKYFPALYSKDKINANTVERIELKPTLKK